MLSLVLLVANSIHTNHTNLIKAFSTPPKGDERKKKNTLCYNKSYIKVFVCVKCNGLSKNDNGRKEDVITFGYMLFLPLNN